MIGQYFSQTNESATIPVLQNILELNKAFVFSCCNNDENVTGWNLEGTSYWWTGLLEWNSRLGGRDKKSSDLLRIFFFFLRGDLLRIGRHELMSIDGRSPLGFIWALSF